MKKSAIVLIIVIGLFRFFNTAKDKTTVDSTAVLTSRKTASSEARRINNSAQETADDRKNKAAGSETELAQDSSPPTKEKATSGTTPKNDLRDLLGYEIVDGLAVIEGDIVLGVAESGKKYGGPSPNQTLQLWPGAIVPYVIQGDLPHPERVIEAMALMTTGVTFQSYSGQPDVLVFEPGSGNCRSYLGRVGGKQPLWIGPGCGAKEIAHEIMHALGFIHEQNRADRDSFIEIRTENIRNWPAYGGQSPILFS